MWRVRRPRWLRWNWPEQNDRAEPDRRLARALHLRRWPVGIVRRDLGGDRRPAEWFGRGALHDRAMPERYHPRGAGGSPAGRRRDLRKDLRTGRPWLRA